MRITLILAVGWLLALAQAVPVASVADARAELERMLETDQQYRNELSELSQEKGADHPEVKALWDKQLELDKRNLHVLERIIAVHGWSDARVFGRDAATAAFLVLQHADLKYQLEYLPLFRQAVEEGKASKSDLALLVDRVRVRQGKPQLYGSQVRQALDGTSEPYPIEDEANVDARRAEMELEPLADYLAYFGIEYKRP